ncbi:GIY-YIG nuclease family protein [candidate division KSB1 bacterium]|nr:GIY-YIG nuclease family protein [candidate division KSB1 bacterium]
MKDTFTAKVDHSPPTPGVYLMRDDKGSIIYVGKFINIRKRLLQHAASLGAGGRRFESFRHDQIERSAVYG